MVRSKIVLNCNILLIILMVLAGLNPYSVLGQDCDSKLNEANRAYYNGDFTTVLQLLKPCADQMTSKQNRLEAYALMAQASILTEDDQAAHDYTLQALKTDPFYTPRPNDLEEYRDIYEQIEIRNFLNLGFSAGLNQPSFSILDYHSYASVTDEPSSYESNTGINISLWGAYYLIYDFYIRTGFGFQQHEFFQQEVIFDYQSVSSRETYQYFSIPIQLEYQFSKWDVKPFVNAGVSYHILNSAKADILNNPIESTVPNPFGGVSRSLDSYDISDLRTTGNWNLLIGGGLRYQIKHFAIEASIYYENGENNLVKESARYSDAQLHQDYSYVSDDFKLRQLNVNLGIVYSFLTPKRSK